MFRFDWKQNIRVATKSVKVVIDAEETPEYLFIYEMRVKVFDFVQKPKVCFKCHKFGHYKDRCNSETVNRIVRERKFVHRVATTHTVSEIKNAQSTK